MCYGAQLRPAIHIMGCNSIVQPITSAARNQRNLQLRSYVRVYQNITVCAFGISSTCLVHSGDQ